MARFGTGENSQRRASGDEGEGERRGGEGQAAEVRREWVGGGRDAVSGRDGIEDRRHGVLWSRQPEHEHEHEHEIMLTRYDIIMIDKKDPIILLRGITLLYNCSLSNEMLSIELARLR